LYFFFYNFFCWAYCFLISEITFPSLEKILLRDDLKLRHFVTNNKNELYEDKEGNIYISADKKGIYKLNFSHFRNWN